MSIKERFGVNLKRARRLAGLSQEELATLTEIHRTQISFLENGKRTPRLDTFLKLVCALQIPADDLLEGMAWKPSPLSFGSYEVTASASARL
ncbi:MAG TPA: helix-turn-helix transcriptional regulator [Solirubrobacterales bacterium]|nr:helix-turn-helix transcriptional regulator [Solirubrobacterales bacterium]